MTDRLRVLERVTKSWKTTNTIAKELNIYWGVAMGILGMLCKDGYVEYMEIMRFKSAQYLWRRTDVQP